jgi:hypothetical protein
VENKNVTDDNAIQGSLRYVHTVPFRTVLPSKNEKELSPFLNKMVQSSQRTAEEKMKVKKTVDSTTAFVPEQRA